MRSGCVDQSWWGGRLACMADSLVKHVNSNLAARFILRTIKQVS